MIQTEILKNPSKETESYLLSSQINPFPLIKNFPKFNMFNASKETKKMNFPPKKKGRRKKCLNNCLKSNDNERLRILNENNVHNIYSNDNIKRRIKTLFNNYIIKLLNNLIKQKFKNIPIKFLKMDIRVTKDIGIEYNRNLLNQPLKDIIVNISNKYKNKENNKNCIKFIEEQKDNEEIINILNTTYEQLYINYLNTTKKDSLDNSFESHKEKLLKLYGKEYYDKFIENTNKFIEYFKKGKKRKSRKLQVVDIINVPLEKNNDNIENNEENNAMGINMVESFAQTDLCDINAKIIAIY